MLGSIIGLMKGATRSLDCDSWSRYMGTTLDSKYIPKGPRTQIIGFWGPNTMNIIVFGP